MEINECANVGAVTAAVAEGSNEVGTVYYSDTYGFEDRLQILEVVPYELTGNVYLSGSNRSSIKKQMS